MKVYYPKTIIPDPERQPRTAETLRSIFVSRYPDQALHENDIQDHDQFIEIEVPDIRLSAIKHLAEDKYEQMEPILRKRAVRSYIAQMNDSEIHEVMDASDMEYEAELGMRY